MDSEKKEKEMDSARGACGAMGSRLLFLHRTRGWRGFAGQETIVIMLEYRGRDLSFTSNTREDRTEKRNFKVVSRFITETTS